MKLFFFKDPKELPHHSKAHDIRVRFYIPVKRIKHGQLKPLTSLSQKSRTEINLLTLLYDLIFVLHGQTEPWSSFITNEKIKQRKGHSRKLKGKDRTTLLNKSSLYQSQMCTTNIFSSFNTSLNPNSCIQKR